MTYLTSDTHFSHTNIIRYCERPFGKIKENEIWIAEESQRPKHLWDPILVKILKEATEEHDEALTNNWNNVVGKSDTVYHNGDFSFRGGPAKKYLDRLNGNVLLCLGNHDIEKDVRDAGFFHIAHYRKIKYNHEKFILSHYPIAEWDTCHHGSYMLYGHVHGSRDHLTKFRTMDVGVDSNNYTPILIEDIIEKLEKREYYPHHTADLKKEVNES